jgi:DNA transformation protein
VAPEDIVELFSAFGPVTVRRMFGGAGIYAGETMFALIADGAIYLKAGDGNVAMFDHERLAPFTYTTSQGRRGVMSYRRMPDRLYDDPEELAVWACAALAAARQPKSTRRKSNWKQAASAPSKSRTVQKEPGR